MADIVNSSSCSCLPVLHYNLLRCFGFESNNPSSEKAPTMDAGIPPVNTEANKSSSEESSIKGEKTINVLPLGNNEVNKNPISEESSIEDSTIIEIFPPGNGNTDPGSEDSSVRDETIIRVFPGGKGDMIPIPVESSAGDETFIGVFPGGNDEAKNNPSSTEQPPVTGGDFVVPEVIIPGEWGRADPIKGRINIGGSGRTH